MFPVTLERNGAGGKTLGIGKWKFTKVVVGTTANKERRLLKLARQLERTCSHERNHTEGT